MTGDRRRLLVGFMQWFGTGLGLISAYMLTLDSFAEWDWFTVSKGAIGHVGAGIAALALFFKPEAATETRAKPVDTSPVVEFDTDQDHANRINNIKDFVDIAVGHIKPLDIPLLRKELRRDEGVVYEIYLDSLGHKTAGVGRLITEDMPEYNFPVGTKIDEETVEEWFTEDVNTAITDAHLVVDVFDSHPRRVKHALVNLAFNLGRERLSGFKNTLALINARRYQEASIELLNSRYAEQVKTRAMRVSGWIASAETNLELS